jgi:iron complex outermembrane receptor protein
MLWALGLALGGLAVAMPSALAQAPAQGAAPGQGAEARHSFSIPAGPLGQALNAFAAAAGLELTADASLLQGRSSPGLSGSYSIAEGFAELLRGQGLRALREANGSYTLGRERTGISAQGEAQMPAVTVRAQAPSATEAYAGGQVASGSRMGLLGDKDFMDTPFSTIGYTEKFIADRQARDITDVISAADPTVFSTGMTGIISENYSIRGFSSSIGDVTFGGLFGVAPYYRASPEMFERVEVLKGPSALLNGMPPGGSVGGTVNLVPKRAGDEPLARLTTSFMSDAQLGVAADLGRRFGEGKQFGIRFNGVVRDGDGAIDHQEKQTRLASLGLDWRGDGARLSADLYSSEDRTDGLNRGVNLAAGLAVPRPPRADTLLNPSWAFYDTRDKGGMLRGEIDLGDRMTAYAALGASKTDYRSTGAYLIQVFNDAGDYRTNLADLGFEMDKRSAEAGLKGRLQTGVIAHQWALNATHYTHTDKQFGRRNVLAQDWITNIYNPVWGPATAFSVAPISRTELRLTSIGVADTLSLAEDRVQLTLGLRRQQVVSDTFNVATGARTSRYDEGATTPAVALLVKASQRVSVYANYIEGLSQGATAPLTAANAGEVFAPYKSRQKELGLKIDMGDFAHTFSLYEILRPNGYTDPVSNVFSFGGQQRNRGLEWGFFGSVATGVRLMGGIAYVQPKLTRTAGGINQGRQAAGVPRLQAKMGVEWDVPALQGLTLTANATTASRQYINADNSLSVPGRTIFDVGARYATTVAGHPVTLRGSITNLANKAYWATPQWTSLGLGAPRTFMLSASVDF